MFFLEAFHTEYTINDVVDVPPEYAISFNLSHFMNVYRHRRFGDIA